MKVCPPYQSECYTEYNMADPVVMAEKSYANAFEVGGSYRVESNFAIYNLNGQYDVIRFEAGHIDGRDMEEFSLLLNDAISSIIAAKEESDLDSLFRRGGTTALLSTISGIEDFELISFLVVK